jgi:Zn-finger nucleic acid-binding protein
MQCPTCPALLLRLEVGAIELDECPRCLGMWFDQGELQALMGEALEATRNLQQRYLPPTGEEKVPARAACPRCVTGRLVEQEEGGHLLAGCRRCHGSWVPGTLLSYILSLEDLPEDPAEVAAAPAPAPPDIHPALPSAAAPMPVPAPIVATRRPTPLPEVKGKCPACARALRPVTHEGQAFHRCESCEAVFFPRGGLPHFLSHKPRTYRPPASLAAMEPEGQRPCPGCQGAMDPMRWQSRPVRVWACEGCWGTFVSPEGVRRLVDPERYMEDAASGPALAVWRAFDRFTDWLVRPSARGHFRHLRGGRYQ